MSDAEKDLAEKLKSANTDEVYDALLKIRKSYVRNHSKMKNLQKYSVIELIIPFLEHPKFCSISLSIIADGCLDLSFVKEVIKCNGIKSLMQILKSFVNEDIQNRACRALGNMAKFEIGFKAVHHVKPVSNIVHFLSETNNISCQHTAVRTLMILGKNSKTRELITRENGIVSIAKLLYSSNVQLLICSTKAIASLTQNCSLSCARQFLELQLLKVLVELHSQPDKSVRNHVLTSLKNLSSQEEIRSGLIKVGAVKLFTEVSFSSESHEMSRLAALALCNCLDHIHMWSHNGTDRAVGLKALLVVLQSERFHDIHLRIITSLIPFSYESTVTDILLNLDVLQILIHILKNFMEKHKCKSFLKSSFTSDLYVEPSGYCEREIEFSPMLQFNLSDSSPFKIDEKTETSMSKDLKEDHEKSQDISSSKTVTKWDRSLYSFSSITSDYSSSCSPTTMCSPLQKFSASPEINYELDVGSSGHTSSGVWSPVSLESENRPFYVTCWSPVVSTQSDSSSPDKDTSYNLGTDDTSELLITPAKSTFSNIDFEELPELTTDYCDFSLPSTSKSDDLVKRLLNFKQKSYLDEIVAVDPETQAMRKKLKTEDINEKNTESQAQISSNSSEMNISDIDAKHISYDKQLSNSNQLIESVEMQTIDHYILLFILQLSFHLEKKTNSQLADNFFFSVLIDYLCVIHNPSPKAEIVLLNLIKNRYCFEKLIVNGFISELEEKMTSSNYTCVHRSCVNLTYSNLITVGKQEAESDYGVGTLSHILATSEKIGQFHAICALSKLVTEKASLHRLLFQANGLSLLFKFLSDNDITTKKKAVIALCELYQSLNKEQKSEKCCFLGTCSMKTSTKCCYKESFLNVTFSVGSGVKILANREKICEKSDYFNALLKGHFQETKAELVSLPHISAENISTIFHFLHGCGSDNCCPYIKRIPFSVLLELLSDCEKFLLMDIKAFVEDRLCHRLFPSTVSRIFRQSKIHNSPALTKRTLDFALNIDTLQKSTLWNCFEELMNLESDLNLFGDIKCLLKDIF